MFIPVLAFLAGICLVFYLPSLVPREIVLMLLPCLMPMVWFGRKNLVWVVTGCLVLGFCWASHGAGALLEKRLGKPLEGKDLVVTGEISAIPIRQSRGYRFQFNPEKARLQDRPVVLKGELLLSTYDPKLSLHAGQKWRFTVRLKRPHGMMNPGGFDYEAWLFRQGITATGYVRSDPAPQLLQRTWSLHGWRQSLATSISTKLAGAPFSGIIRALVTGDRSDLQPDHWRTLQLSGTAHLVAISGLHIGLVAGFVYLLVRAGWSSLARAPLLWPAPRAAALAALVAATVYAMMAGFSLPTQRALLMLALATIGIAVNRPLPFAQIYWITLGLVLVLDPLAVMDVGFWLSFAAVGLLVYLAQGRRHWSRIRHFIYLQPALGILLLPWTLLFFYQIQISAPVANLLAIPLFSLLVVPSALTGTVFSITGPEGLATVLLEFAAGTVRLVWPIIDWLSGLTPVNGINSPGLGLWFVILSGSLICFAPPGWPLRWLGIPAMALLFMVRPDPLQPGRLQLSVLDVGQGLAIVIRSRNQTLVYDSGPRYSDRFSAGSAIVEPYLRASGRHRIDRLILSHGDNDHAGGVSGLRDRIAIGDILSGGRTAGLPGDPCDAGQVWIRDGIRYSVLHPEQQSPYQGNNAGCVILIDTGQHRILLTGDIEEAAERALVAREGDNLAADILIAPHHGSKTSSSPDFLARVRPGLVLVSAGYRNRFRHPHPDVVARYHEQGIRTVNTADSGAIEVELNPQGYRLNRYRSEYRRFWHDR